MREVKHFEIVQLCCFGAIAGIFTDGVEPERYDQ